MGQQHACRSDIIGLINKGQFAIESDPEDAWVRRMTHRYEAPEQAEKDIADGDWVWMENPQGHRVKGWVALTDGIDRAEHQLDTAASLERVGWAVKVTNLTGHKLITGYPEGRRMWLNIKWYDVTGTLVREDGAYGDLAVTLPGQSLTVRTILDLEDSNTKIYEAHYGMTQQWAAQLVALGYPQNLVLGYNRVTGAEITLSARLNVLFEQNQLSRSRE